MNVCPYHIFLVLQSNQMPYPLIREERGRGGLYIDPSEIYFKLPGDLGMSKRKELSGIN